MAETWPCPTELVGVGEGLGVVEDLLLVDVAVDVGIGQLQLLEDLAQTQPHGDGAVSEGDLAGRRPATERLLLPTEGLVEGRHAGQAEAALSPGPAGGTGPLVLVGGLLGVKHQLEPLGMGT